MARLHIVKSADAHWLAAIEVQDGPPITVRMEPHHGGWKASIPEICAAGIGEYPIMALHALQKNGLERYAISWVEHLHRDPVHAPYSRLVKLVMVSEPYALARWLHQKCR